MGGVILETLSNKKLAALGVCFLLGQLTAFLLGGLLAPAPYSTSMIEGSVCKEDHKTSPNHWYVPWAHNENMTENCARITNLGSLDSEAGDIVFAFRFPLPRDGMVLDMSRWFQNIIAVLHVDKPYHSELEQNEFENSLLTFDARLGYRDKGDNNWTELTRSRETRKLTCTLEDRAGDQYTDCETLPFFEVGSCHHDYYLINMRLPSENKYNADIGVLSSLRMIEIHQNGGFTKIWFSLKTVMFPVLLATLVWFSSRVSEQPRAANLLEKMLFAMGVTLSFLDLPVEWFTLWIHMPFMLLFSDIRQGIFYTMLLSFWVIFTGEHLMDQQERNRLVCYWKHLSAVAFGCICLFVFEMCERGVQIHNPFYSIWATPTSANLAQGFLIVAMIAACVYFVFLCYMIICVFRNISAKKSVLPSMSAARQKFYMGLMFRFKFLMLATLACAALTVVAFIVAQVSEGHWKWGTDNSIQYTSAVQTGVFGMWNLYVISLLVLYAPSHKSLDALNNDDDESTEQVEFSTIPTESSALTAMVSKSNQE